VQIVFHKDQRGIYTQEYNNHSKECDGKQHSKQLKVWDNEFPYTLEYLKIKPIYIFLGFIKWIN
jgi:hypothetical protein